MAITRCIGDLVRDVEIRGRDRAERVSVIDPLDDEGQLASICATNPASTNLPVRGLADGILAPART